MNVTDEFILEHAQRYLRLVAAYKPPPAPASKETGETMEDAGIVIVTRLRPMLGHELSSGMVPGLFPREHTKGQVDLHELRRPVRGLPRLNSFTYRVDKFYGVDTSSEDMYHDLVHPLVAWAWGGGVSTVFAYGQTGSGKTYTVSALERLVASTLTGGALEGRREMHVSIIELAGNTAADLLNARKPISVLEDSFGATHLAGAAEHPVTDVAALLAHVDAAARFRRTASTTKNDASSRSHAVCRLRLVNPALPDADDGLLYLVDLAGSEAARDVATHGADRMRETREINVSLSVLKDCIRGRAAADHVTAAAAGQKKAKPPYVPFRQSALTKVLKHVFDPAASRACRTVVVACVNPCLADVGASKNTLRYAEMLRVVAPAAPAVMFDAGKPATWSNEQLRAWVGKNSGTPPVVPQILAPSESGAQLLRLVAAEFLTRCLRSPGVTDEQARAFQAKFWRLHVDSQRATATPVDAKAAAAPEKTGLSSADPRPDMAGVPFTERIRPGLVVAFDPPADMPMPLPGRNLAVVLGADGARAQGRYTCARVTPGFMPNAFEVCLWRQVVVPVERMVAEVLLEYDVATRYYYETL
ncbi:hypothetical protein VD0002_g519 [Verticillium dahliae]|uniref:Diatom spindle kinesin 1 n=2 Tax=Verticillium dahliae TaxID=27337 RepID=G2XBV2_VERDV|nr:diatom spindle kinesin 1 [Verticillium dahliae VdLs.17]KAH6699238.1 diatom spindle kinesin 1 [Verticillium dahliae]EGY16470.1 diatom spindle kinesin 1 [Verticillium dahliae VdLs.17]PNH32646.1 hypothetical protein BJF96_g3993 [Verticillium dahliae]PNH57256.1 hypothetical protein VD0003_g549 [Verticillium dahliae]PNH70008.1 hypothetical protein VD0002_g519 [Verticillium dahliae]